MKPKTIHWIRRASKNCTIHHIDWNPCETIHNFIYFEYILWAIVEVWHGCSLTIFMGLGTWAPWAVCSSFRRSIAKMMDAMKWIESLRFIIFFTSTTLLSCCTPHVGPSHTHTHKHNCNSVYRVSKYGVMYYTFTVVCIFSWKSLPKNCKVWCEILSWWIGQVNLTQR